MLKAKNKVKGASIPADKPLVCNNYCIPVDPEFRTCHQGK